MTGIADHALSQHFGRVHHVQATLPLATCERRALDGVAGFGEAMKGDGVKRLRKEEITGRDKGGEAEGCFMPSGLFQIITDLAGSEPQATGKVFARCAVVRWRREKDRTHLATGCEAEGGFIAVCALWNTSVIAMARGLRFILQAP